MRCHFRRIENNLQHTILQAACFSFILAMCGTLSAADKPPIKIDGKFGDWAHLPKYEDPEGDTHDTDPRGYDEDPKPVEHVDVDLLEYRLAHDDKALYFYMRAKGQIGRTEKGDADGKGAGRYYVNLTIDVDQNDETGYSLNGGGYHPNSRGYDVNAELEFYNGALNVAKYLNHCVPNAEALPQAFLDQSSGKYQKGKNGPYPAGFMTFAPSVYADYTEWVYHDDDTITFVRDAGPAVGLGVVSYALSGDGREIEMRFPYRGFLKDEKGKPIIGVGSVLDVSYSLEASGESVNADEWASDTAEPILKYRVTPTAK